MPIVLLYCLLLLSSWSTAQPTAPLAEAVPVERVVPLARRAVPMVIAKSTAAPPPKPMGRWAVWVSLGLTLLLIGLLLWIFFVPLGGTLVVTGYGCLTIIFQWMVTVGFSLLVALASGMLANTIIVGIVTGAFLTKRQYEKREARKVAQAEARRAPARSRYPNLPGRYVDEYQHNLQQLADLEQRQAQLDQQYEGATYYRAARYKEATKRVQAKRTRLIERHQALDELDAALADVPAIHREYYLELHQQAAQLRERLAADAYPERLIVRKRAELEGLERQMVILKDTD